jgi:hypothetical protein
MNSNGTIIGHGVGFYLASDVNSVTINADSTVDLSAYDDYGNTPMDGKLFAMEAVEPTKNNTISVKINGGSGLDLRGTVYLPNGDLEISGTSPSSYVWNQLAEGKPVYVDRFYEYFNLPSGYTGLDILQTENDDKHSSGSAFLSFEVNQPVTVLVAHDDRIDPKPAWLDSFTPTGDALDIGGEMHQVYSKDYNAGTIELGGNQPQTGVDSPNSMYTVIVLPQDNTSFDTQSLPFTSGESATPEHPAVSLTAVNQGQLTWQSVPGISYEVLAADNLTDPDWVVLETVSADTETTSWTDPDSGSAVRFYRVKQVNETSTPSPK